MYLESLSTFQGSGFCSFPNYPLYLKCVSLTFTNSLSLFLLPASSPSPFFFLLLLWSIALYSLMPSTVLSPSQSAPHCPPPPAFSLAGWLIHCIVCSLQVYPGKSTPAVDQLCVGVPASEVSQMLQNYTSNFSTVKFVWNLSTRRTLFAQWKLEVFTNFFI